MSLFLNLNHIRMSFLFQFYLRPVILHGNIAECCSISRSSKTWKFDYCTTSYVLNHFSDLLLCSSC